MIEQGNYLIVHKDEFMKINKDSYDKGIEDFVNALICVYKNNLLNEIDLKTILDLSKKANE